MTKQFKGLIEEKLQHRSNDKSRDEVDHHKAPSSPITPEEGGGKKGLKFGIRVLPPVVNEKLFGKSPTKADNDNNTNLEKSKVTEVNEKQQSPKFNRQGSVTSSGIKRDAAGIPQEMPEHMMQAALSAKEHRKTNNSSADSKSNNNKNKGKAPRPPPVEIDMNISTETMDTTLDINSPRPVNMTKSGETMNFTDNFNELMSSIEDSITDRPSNSSTPKSDRKKHPSDTESQINARYDNGMDICISYICLKTNIKFLRFGSRRPYGLDPDRAECQGHHSSPDQ